MIRIKFNFNKKDIQKILDDKKIWNNAHINKNGDAIIYCYADIDTAHVDDEGYDCFFYAEKPKELWNKENVKPRLLFKARTMITYLKWREQFKEFWAKVQKSRDEMEKAKMKELL